jgi:hypothetical protein
MDAICKHHCRYTFWLDCLVAAYLVMKAWNGCTNVSLGEARGRCRFRNLCYIFAVRQLVVVALSERDKHMQ